MQCNSLLTSHCDALCYESSSIPSNSLNKKVENIVVLLLSIIMHCTPLLSIMLLNMGRPKLNKTK